MALSGHLKERSLPHLHCGSSGSTHNRKMQFDNRCPFYELSRINTNKRDWRPHSIEEEAIMMSQTDPSTELKFAVTNTLIARAALSGILSRHSQGNARVNLRC